MSLRPIVAALGGDLYSGGARASVPAPGHSPADRSMSLMLSHGRVVIHGFGEADWRVMRDDLVRRGLIDPSGRLTGGGPAVSSGPRPDRRQRVATAARLWAGSTAVAPGSAADLYLRRRAVRGGGVALALGLHPAAPTSVYRSGGPVLPALVARVSDANDVLTAVELTYLQPNGRPATGLTPSRKTVGRVPPGAAVRLALAGEAMLVGEGVVTTLSAMDRFGLPGWALMTAHNLAAWTAPPEARHVLIAADAGTVGEAAALKLRRRLVGLGLAAEAVWPDAPFGDWNDVEAAAAAWREEEGR
jgi:hypothetical protein